MVIVGLSMVYFVVSSRLIKVLVVVNSDYGWFIYDLRRQIKRTVNLCWWLRLGKSTVNIVGSWLINSI